MISASSLPLQIKYFNKFFFGNVPFRVVFEGCKFFIRPRSYDPYVLGETLSEKVYQPDQNTPVNVVVDLGAYMGDFSVWAASHLKSKKVIAVEMDRDNFDLLSMNVKLNRLEKKIVLVNSAIMSKDGNVDIEVNRVNAGMHRIANSRGGDTRSVTLETLMKKNNIKHIDLLKMDIEGSEKYLFVDSNRKLFEKKVGCIIMETHPKYYPEDRIVDYLKKLDFRVILKRQEFRRGGLLTAYKKI